MGRLKISKKVETPEGVVDLKELNKRRFEEESGTEEVKVEAPVVKKPVKKKITDKRKFEGFKLFESIIGKCQKRVGKRLGYFLSIGDKVKFDKGEYIMNLVVLESKLNLVDIFYDVKAGGEVAWTDEELIKHLEEQIEKLKNKN